MSQKITLEDMDFAMWDGVWASKPCVAECKEGKEKGACGEWALGRSAKKLENFLVLITQEGTFIPIELLNWGQRYTRGLGGLGGVGLASREACGRNCRLLAALGTLKWGPRALWNTGSLAVC